MSKKEEICRPPTPFLVILALLCLDVIVALAGYPNHAYAMNLIILLGALIYVILYHSKKRWPDVGVMRRVYRLLTFYRD